MAKSGGAIFSVLLVGLSVSGIAAQDFGALDKLYETKPSRSRRISSTNPNDPSNRDNVWVKSGETRTIADIVGSGVIRHIWMTFAESSPNWLSKEGAARHDEVVIRCYWDDAKEPQVEAPIGDFFALGFGKRAEVKSIPIQVQGGDAYNSFWPMPFHRSARITVTNESQKPFAALYFHIDWTEEKLASDAAYFCAQYRQEYPTRLGRDYLILDAEGEGHYVGTVMSVRTRSPEWFGEGDEKFEIDGEARPSIRGTGTEDYFLNAWGLEKSTFPNFGVTVLGGEWGAIGALFCAYRWHTEAPIRFQKALRVTIEHMGWMSADETTTGKVEGFVEREDDFATVAFWYQKGKVKRFAPIPPLAERRWPSIDFVIEGKTLLDGAVVKGGETSLQSGGEWTGDGQLFFDAKEDGATIETGFTIDKETRRRVVFAITHSYDFGRYTISLDSEEVLRDVDFFAKDVELVEHTIGDRTLATGRHTLKIVCTGRNDNSKGRKLGFDSIRLRERSATKRPPAQLPR